MLASGSGFSTPGSPTTPGAVLQPSGSLVTQAPKCSQAALRCSWGLGIDLHIFPVTQGPMSQSICVYNRTGTKCLLLAGIKSELMILNRNQTVPHGVSPRVAPGFPVLWGGGVG